MRHALEAFAPSRCAGVCASPGGVLPYDHGVAVVFTLQQEGSGSASGVQSRCFHAGSRWLVVSGSTEGGGGGAEAELD